MKILIVGLVNNPQLKRLQTEGKARGHQVDGCYTSELVIEASTDVFLPSLRGKKFDGYDLIYLWAVGKRRWEWYSAALHLAKTTGVTIVNAKAIANDYNYYLASASDYLKQFENKLTFPKSAVVFDEMGAKFAADKFRFPVIVKKSEGRQGKGVFKVDNLVQLLAKITELKAESPSFVIREFIPNDGDIRVFTVGYKAIGAMKRTPQSGDFRSNISQGGSGEKYALDSYPIIRDIAEKLSEITRTEIAGVDIMIHSETNVPYILEINPGPQFTGLEKYTGVNAAGEIINYFEKLHETTKGK